MAVRPDPRDPRDPDPPLPPEPDPPADAPADPPTRAPAITDQPGRRSDPPGTVGNAPTSPPP
ncbi:hypothetical protein [Actinomadura gamaensis]|uniref:Uncharacterized protein n=1 Tax=Actinomadura gamaensis TaxID=1763541 RepID=A0ABV9U7I9_9ACTN